jgi:acyl carrier protein
MGLDQVEMIMDIEDAFELQFSDGEAQAVKTVGDLVHLVQTKVAERRHLVKTWSAPEIAHRVREIISRNTGVKIDKLHDDARFSEDLGIE